MGLEQAGLLQSKRRGATNMRILREEMQEQCACPVFHGTGEAHEVVDLRDFFLSQKLFLRVSPVTNHTTKERMDALDVASAVLDYLLSVKHLAEKSQKGYQQRLGVFADWCSEHQVQLEQVNNRHVQIFLAFLKSTHRSHKHNQPELSTRTLSGYVQCISVFLHWCLSDDEYSQYVRLQSVRGIKSPRLEQFVISALTEQEIRALFDACQHPEKRQEFRLRDTAILALLLDCGLRSEELRTLKIGGVTLARNVKEDSFILVTGKGRKQREIPLGNRARRALARYIRECRKSAAKQEAVFLSRQGDVQLSHEGLRDILERLRDFSTLPKDTQVNPHRFRHTFATRYMANGGDVYDLSRMLGHSSVAITENYLKSLSTQQVRKRKEHKSVLDSL